jgi:putative membrane protein
VRALCFIAGLGAVGAGLMLSDESLALHMLGHGLIVAIGAPLIVLGRPVSFLLRTLPRPAARDLAQLLRAPLTRALLWPPLAFGAFAAAQLAFHLTPLFEQTLRDGPLHELEHALFFWTALWLWTVCLAVEPLPRRWPPLARALLLLAAMPVSDAGAIRLMLDGEREAGGAMVVAMVPFGLAAAAIAWRALLREEHDEGRRPGPEVPHAAS